MRRRDGALLFMPCLVLQKTLIPSWLTHGLCSHHPTKQSTQQMVPGLRWLDSPAVDLDAAAPGVQVLDVTAHGGRTAQPHKSSTQPPFSVGCKNMKVVPVSGALREAGGAAAVHRVKGETLPSQSPAMSRSSSVPLQLVSLEVGVVAAGDEVLADGPVHGLPHGLAPAGLEHVVVRALDVHQKAQERQALACHGTHTRGGG